MDNRKYYYLKLRDTFFDNEEMKILESQVNGVEYQNLYLKLCLLSLKQEGRLVFRADIPYEEEMLSSITRVNIDTIKTGIELFVRLGIMEVLDTGTMYMTDIQSLIGRGSSEGDRKADYRKRIALEREGTKKGQLSQECPPEIEIEIEREKEKERNTKNGKYVPLAELLYKEHLKHDSKYLHGKTLESVFLRWADDIRKLIEIDGRTDEDVRSVIKWCQSDGCFWVPNILSGSKLRDKFPVLWSQYKGRGQKKKSNSGYFEKNKGLLKGLE